MNKKEKLLQEWNGGVLRGAQAKLAKELELTQSAITRWMNGIQIPSEENIRAIAKVLGQPIQKVKDAFLSENLENVFSPEDVQFIPVWGIVSAATFKGSNLTEEPIDFVPLPTKDKRIFAVKVKGSCMEPTIKSGEYVILKKQEYTDYDGQIVLAVVDDEYTLKRLFVTGNEAELRPINTEKFKAIIKPLKEVFIKGVYRGVFRKDDFL